MKLSMASLVSLILTVSIAFLSALWIMITTLVLTPLNDINKNLQEFKNIYYQEMTQTKERVVYIEKRVDRLYHNSKME